ERIIKKDSKLKRWRKPDDECARLLNEVKTLAQHRGFPEFEIKIWKMPWHVITDCSGLYTRCDGVRNIYIFPHATNKFSEEEMLLLVAHEYGHALDGYTRRVGHPVFKRLKRLSREEFANAIAAYLYSTEQVIRFEEKSGNLEEVQFLRSIEFTRSYSWKPKAY
ncbi:hypothetical protein KW791_01855, partial [Candidatus Parcubacteria bacterium]|nr:hypothetical protein [Candidatus Parcubacteria bacterium]